jgi:hypothetical protein
MVNGLTGSNDNYLDVEDTAALAICKTRTVAISNGMAYRFEDNIDSGIAKCKAKSSKVRWFALKPDHTSSVCAKELPGRSQAGKQLHQGL